MAKAWGPRLRAVGLALLAAVVVAGLVALGVWQVRWMLWQDRIAEQGKIVGASELATITDIEAGFEYGFDVNILRVKLNGYYRHDLERYIPASRDGEPGFKVITPFIEEQGYVVLVDRGWVGEADRAPQTRRDPRNPEGKMSITGVTRINAVSRLRWFPAADTKTNTWYWYDRLGMAFSLPAGLGETDEGVAGLYAALFVQVEPGGEPGEGRLPLVDPLKIQNGTINLIYAIMWFSLAAALAVFTVRHFWQRRRKTKKVVLQKDS